MSMINISQVALWIGIKLQAMLQINPSRLCQSVINISDTICEIYLYSFDFKFGNPDKMGCLQSSGEHYKCCFNTQHWGMDGLIVIIKTAWPEVFITHNTGERNELAWADHSDEPPLLSAVQHGHHTAPGTIFWSGGLRRHPRPNSSDFDTL